MLATLEPNHFMRCRLHGS